jgi:hypothetical protein
MSHQKQKNKGKHSPSDADGHRAWIHYLAHTFLAILPLLFHPLEKHFCILKFAKMVSFSRIIASCLFLLVPALE